MEIMFTFLWTVVRLIIRIRRVLQDMNDVILTPPTLDRNKAMYGKTALNFYFFQ